MIRVWSVALGLYCEADDRTACRVAGGSGVRHLACWQRRDRAGRRTGTQTVNDCSILDGRCGCGKCLRVRSAECLTALLPFSGATSVRVSSTRLGRFLSKLAAGSSASHPRIFLQ